MRILVGLLALMITPLIWAQQPESVYSVTKEQKEKSWYELQLRLWGKEVEKNEKNANAWYNYYSAARALRNLPLCDRPMKNKYRSLCDSISTEAIKAIPETFEGNHIVWWNSGNDPEKLSFLMKAYEIDPDDSRAYDDLMIQYEVSGEEEKFYDMCKKIYEVNELPASLLNWGYNVLSELEENAIVFTAGDNDTYALWVLQGAKNYRRDVTVMNLYLASGVPEYCNSVTDELGLPRYEKAEENEQLTQRFLMHFLKNEKNIPTYVCISAVNHGGFLNSMEDLYLTGLTYKYSSNNFDNISVIRRNYEKRYLLDYMTEQFTSHIGDDVAQQFDALYLPSMIKLYKHYASSEDLLKKARMRKLIVQLSEKSGSQGEIYELLGEDDRGSVNSNFSTSLLDVKVIEKNMIALNGKVFMSSKEASNEDYRKFLNNVMRSRKLELYKGVLYDSAQWNEKFKEEFNEPMKNLYHSHPAYNHYPIVNISHEAAKIYCEWLTKQYNLQRRRKYTQVLFRLPTEREWEQAARGKSNTKTGFKDDNLKNEAGCYLANVQPEKGRFYDDGAFHTAKVGTYFANGGGFFNMIGNVAEMIDVKGVAKGGSWYSLPEECHIDKQMSYSKPDPGVGFRVVMEVIDK